MCDKNAFKFGKKSKQDLRNWKVMLFGILFNILEVFWLESEICEKYAYSDNESSEISGESRYVLLLIIDGTYDVPVMDETA